jgi:uncharacterized protein (DUF2342 family)
MEGLIPEAYTPFAETIFAAFAQPAKVTTESDLAEAVWRASNDATGQLRFPAGADAVGWLKRDDAACYGFFVSLRAVDGGTCPFSRM